MTMGSEFSAKNVLTGTSGWRPEMPRHRQTGLGHLVIFQLSSTPHFGVGVFN
jgi:hypothetical protein